MLDEWVTDKEEINKQLKEMAKGKTEKADGNKSSKDNENTKKNDDRNGMDHSGMDMGSDKKTLVIWQEWTMEI
ncbi:hypothetical protein ACTIGL_17705 [Bacillus shihchuchen]